MKLALCLMVAIVGCKPQIIAQSTSTSDTKKEMDNTIATVALLNEKIKPLLRDRTILDAIMQDSEYKGCANKGWPVTDHCERMAIAYMRVVTKYRTEEYVK